MLSFTQVPKLNHSESPGIAVVVLWLKAQVWCGASFWANPNHIKGLRR